MLTMDSLGKMYGAFDEWRIAAEQVKVLLLVGELDVDRGEEVKLVNMYVNIKEGSVGGEDDTGNPDTIETVVDHDH